MSDGTPDWAEVISGAIRSAPGGRAHRHPGVVKFDAEQKTADVRIVIRDRVVGATTAS